MIVYHGSNVEIDSIDLTKCNKYKDFGQGFYVTTIEEQAIRMAKRTVKRFGGKATVTKFAFNECSLYDLSYKGFEISDEWALMVINNRNNKFNNHQDPLSNHDNKYDILFGPIANDDIATSFAIYTRNLISIDELKRRLEFKELTNQYSFHTEKALNLLTKTGASVYEEN